MLMQSPPMQAAGKSHSSMSVEDQRGRKSWGLMLLYNLKLPRLIAESWVGPTPQPHLGSEWGLDTIVPGLFLGSP